MIDKNIIYRKAEAARKSLERLRSKSGLTQEQFLSDESAQDTMLHHLQIAIQACIDIGQHLISDEGWGMPGTLSEIAYILEDHGVISAEQTTSIVGMFGFRNILVHDYIEVDLKKVYQIWNSKLNDIETYLQAVFTYFGI